MKVERLVVDTHILISASLSPDGSPALLWDHLRSNRTVLVFSEATMAELATRLMRAKFDRYVDQDIRLRFLAEIDAVAECVGVTGAPMGCRDRTDDVFLETALAGDCELLVSGDQDLLSLHPWRGVQILSPARTLDAIAQP